MGQITQIPLCTINSQYAAVDNFLHLWKVIFFSRYLYLPYNFAISKFPKLK